LPLNAVKSRLKHLKVDATSTVQSRRDDDLGAGVSGFEMAKGVGAWSAGSFERRLGCVYREEIAL
jgi:hypothetical protein